MLNFYKLEQLVEESMQAAKVPGVALAVIQGLEVVYAKGFGVTSVEDGGLPVTPQTIFRVGSTSKPLAATVVMKMVEAGKMELDTPITEIMPGLEFSRKGAIEQVTLRKLMSHTSGLPTAANYLGSRESDRFKSLLYEQIPAYRLVAPVGKIWSYSNPGIDLAGYAAEVVSGKPYWQLLQELVFDPLEMTRSTLSPLIAGTYLLAQSHSLDKDGNLHVQHVLADNVAHYPSGFVYSTVLDMAKFAMMHMNGGRWGDQQILSPGSVAEMHRIQVPFASLDGEMGYGLAFFITDYKGVRRVGHGGRIDSYASKFEMIPDRQVAVIIQSSRSAEWTPFEEKITRFIFDGLLGLPAETAKPVALEPDQSRWAAYSGLYNGMLGGVVRIEAADGQLTLEWEGQKLPLQATKDGLYFAEPPDADDVMLVSFVAEADGSVEYVTVRPPANLTLPFKRVVYDPAFKPNPANWKGYPGQYVSDREVLTVRVENGQLFIHHSGLGAEIPVQPVDDRRFIAPVGMITFETAEDGSVPALIVGVPHVFKRTGG